MYTKSTKQLIRDAKILGGVFNSEFTDFQISTSLLNDIYRELYTKLTEEGRFFVKHINFTGNSFDLPNDCYRVLNVYKITSNGSKISLTSNSSDQFIPSTYYIENNCIYINDSDSSEYSIKYSELPMTLTAPDDPIPMPEDKTIESFGLMTQDEVNFRADGTNYVWNFNDNEITETDTFQQVTQPYYFLCKDLVVTTSNNKVTSMLWGNTETEEIIEYFNHPNDEVYITSVVVSDPYIFVNYSDNHIAVFTGFNGTEWNLLESTGKTTLGKIVAAYTNDITGKGVIYYNAYTRKYYLCSFVPDTLLKYPTNTFFSLIEYKLAAMLMSMTGLVNDYLVSVKIPEAEELFYSTLRKDGYAPVRISNVYHK